MDAVLELWRNQWSAYPEWLVVGSLLIVAALLLWLVAKVTFWLLKWLLVGCAIGAGILAVLYFVG